MHQFCPVSRSPLPPDVFETYGKIEHLIRTNRAGDALQGVSSPLQLLRVICRNCRMERGNALLGLFEEATHDPRDRVRFIRWLQLSQLDEPRHIHRIRHDK
jgi:hypothetical protein